MVKVSVVKCEDYDEENVLNAVKKLLRDANFQIPSGKKVLVKPNCLGAYEPSKAITTHPSVLKAVIQLFQEKDCEVSVGESSGFADDCLTAKSLEKSGITKVAKDLGVKLLVFEREKIQQIEVKGEKVPVPANISKFNLIVNVAKLKTHELTQFTGAVKNIFGLIVGARKPYLHSVFPNPKNFSEFLVDLYELMTPKLNIIDGIVGLEGNGPGTAGTPKQTGLLFASKNGFAVDIVASRTIGFDPLEIVTNKIGTERKLVDESISVIGEKIKVDYKKPTTVSSKAPDFLYKFLFKQYARYPFIVPEKCTKCGACVKVCSLKAINNFIVDKKKCITCYCCREFCPHNAIELRMSFLGTLILSLMNIRRRVFGYLNGLFK